jgi:hypothetical protein
MITVSEICQSTKIGIALGKHFFGELGASLNEFFECLSSWVPEDSTSELEGSEIRREFVLGVDSCYTVDRLVSTVP